MTFIPQNSMQIMSLRDFISDNPDRNNDQTSPTSWWSIDVLNQSSVGCDTLHYFVEEHLNNVKMFECSWNDIENLNIKAFASINRRDYLYSKLLTFLKLFSTDKKKKILKSKDIMLFIMMFDNDFMVNDIFIIVNDCDYRLLYKFMAVVYHSIIQWWYIYQLNYHNL